jgi:hypothetical protein
MPERKAFVLRIGKDLWDELQRMAAQELRSVNAQIEYLLREAVRRRGRRVPDCDAGAEAADDAGHDRQD